jgi:membrane-bound serine protease (ClpP class)
MGLISIAFFFAIITLALRSHKKAIITGREGLVGREGIVLSIMNEQIMVCVLGERWEATSSHHVNAAQK